MESNLDDKGNYIYKVDMMVSSKVVISMNRNVSLPDWVFTEMKKTFNEAELKFDEEELKKFLENNCFMKIVYLDFPFTFLWV